MNSTVERLTETPLPPRGRSARTGTSPQTSKTSDYLEPETLPAALDLGYTEHAAAAARTDAHRALGVAQQALQAVQALAARPAPSSRLPESVMAVFRVVALVLAVRLMVVMALVGTFTLALIAMDKATVLHTATVVAFAVLTLGPLVYLEVRNRPAPPAQPAE